MRINIGCDPEFLIIDANGNPVPAHKVGIGDKKHKTDLDDEGLSYFRDGFVVEVNVRPSTCRALLEFDVRTVLRTIQSRLPEGYRLTTRSAFRVKRSDIKDAPDDVKQFGCDPSYDGYTGRQKVVDLDGESHPARYAGGHMHFSVLVKSEVDGKEKAIDTGFSEHVALGNRDNYPLIAQLFDKYVGRPLTYLYDGPEQFARRMFYGQAGEYRPQEYVSQKDGVMVGYKTDGWSPVYGNVKKTSWGFEYRTPPSELWNHNAVATLFFGVGGWVLNNFPALSKSIDKTEQESIRAAIQTGEGLDKPFPTVYGFYDDEMLRALKMRPEIKEFGFIDTDYDTHRGWFEHATMWDINPKQVASCQ